MSDKAKLQWREAIKKFPGFGPAWLGLAEICLEQKRLGEVEQLIEQLARNPKATPIAAAVRSRLLLTQGDFETACQVMEEAIAQTPSFTWLRLLYCDMLLHQDKDPDKAEQQLTEVLAIDPKQKAASQRLQQLRRKRQEAAALARQCLSLAWRCKRGPPMVGRYLFGPVDAAFADHFLHAHRQRGDCLAFDFQNGPDVTVGWQDSWDELSGRFPQGWLPDFVALFLPYRAIPTCLWSAPVPIVGLAADWNLLWHYYRHSLPRCDLVLTDTVGVETLHRQGLRHVRPANLFGWERQYLELPPPVERDINLLFVGSVQPAIQRERLPWVARLAAFSDKWNVLVATGVYGDAYRDLLRRARIVFNRSIRSECNCRAFEATAAGALLFQEADNREMGAYFQDGKEYVAYGADNLEKLLSYYLEHEEERRRIAEAGRCRAQDYGFIHLWEQALAFAEAELAAPIQYPRQPPAPAQDLDMRLWQQVQSQNPPDPGLSADLQAALAAEAYGAVFEHASAVLLVHAAKGKAIDCNAPVAKLRQVLHRNPQHFMAGLNLTEVLFAAGEKTLAKDQRNRPWRSWTNVRSFPRRSWMRPICRWVSTVSGWSGKRPRGSTLVGRPKKPRRKAHCFVGGSTPYWQIPPKNCPISTRRP